MSLLLLASFWLFMASMAVAAIWLVEPARAESFAAAARGTAALTIHIERLSPLGGILRLGVYDAAHYPDDKSQPVAAADVPATAGMITITLKDLPPGRYAIESFQDLNGNGRMDTSWLGLPLEPYGFSRDARPFLSKPGFGAVAFTLAPGENSQTLHLQNSNSQRVTDAGF
ncbi:MAG TPA: DUF2141 domain-containing protein [Rhizomicrobium sp.]|nr:DUF2141 domain-containing protein [Rhizomicrobium sp.]